MGEGILDLSKAVSLSDDGGTIAIGSIDNDGSSGDIGNNQGHVRVFQFNGTSWVQLGPDIDGGYSHDQFGHAVFLSGDGSTVAVGAPRYDGDNGISEDTGQVRVYKYDSGADTWNQVGGRITGNDQGDATGQSVALSFDGKIVAVGSSGSNMNGIDSGITAVYKLASNSNAWLQQGSVIKGMEAYDKAGYSVSLSHDGDVLAVGAIHNNGNGEDSGTVSVFKFGSTGDWIQLGSNIDGYSNHDESGYAVSLSSDGYTVAIGAPKNNESKGHAVVYHYKDDMSAWVQRGTSLQGLEYYDNFGEAVSISGNGNIIAVGAPDSDKDGKVDNGHAQVFEWNDKMTAWNQLGSIVTGVNGCDKFGSSVSLSGNGKCLAVSGPKFDVNPGGTAYLNGHVRILCQKCYLPSSPTMMILNPSAIPSTAPTKILTRE